MNRLPPKPSALAAAAPARAGSARPGPARRRSRSWCWCARTRGSPARPRDEIETRMSGATRRTAARAGRSCVGVGEAVQEGRSRSPRRRSPPARAPAARHRRRRAPASDRAVGQRALRHVEAQVARHERLGQLQHRGRTGRSDARGRSRPRRGSRRGQQRGAGALALDDRVGDQGRAVDHLVPTATGVDRAGRHDPVPGTGRGGRRSRSATRSRSSSRNRSGPSPCPTCGSAPRSMPSPSSSRPASPVASRASSTTRSCRWTSIISQDPPALAAVPPQSPVSYVVSLGPGADAAAPRRRRRQRRRPSRPPRRRRADAHARADPAADARQAHAGADAVLPVPRHLRL